MKFKQYIVESSLSRIWQYVQEDTRSFAVISAFRGDKSTEENEQRHVELKKLVRKMGLGFVEMRGGYREDEGFVNEKSIFIPNISEKQAVNLEVKFEQDGILYKDDKGFYEIGTNKRRGVGTKSTKFVTKGGKNNISRAKEVIKDFFSVLLKGGHAGKKFIFALQEKTEVGHLSRMAGHKPEWVTIYEEEE